MRTILTTTTEAVRGLEDQIHNITGLTDEECLLLERVVERAYVHIMIERHLRHSNPRVS